MGRFRNQLLFLVLGPALLFQSGGAADLPTPTVTIPDSYFGLHIHHLDFPAPTPWPSMPVPEWRLWDAGVNWPDLEPNKGQWQFGRLDRYVSLAQGHGTGLLLPLGGSPTWASARPQVRSNYSPGFTAEPANLDDWRAYVATVVTRYKSRIQAYEIWNEPNLKDFWSGTLDQMVTLTKEASEIIHRLDPHAIVVSPSATTSFGLQWFSDFLRAGGGRFVDVIGYHLYVDKEPENLLPLIQRVRQVMADNNLGSIPLWNTESGWLNPARFNSDEVAAGFLARAYILAWASGVQRFYWYAWDNRAMSIVTYREDEHVVTPAGHAYEIMEQWLVGARMNGCAESADHTWTCQLNRAGKKEWIVWNTQEDQKFDVPAAWHVKSATPLLHDPYSLDNSRIDIGPAPTLLTGRS
jgi:glycosyl hydrolase family 39 (putative alpha-L-iduronidase)